VQSPIRAGRSRDKHYACAMKRGPDHVQHF
jgi:hypothetical protein